MATASETASFALSTAVVFCVFDRPELTRQVFAEIRRAQPPRLLVVADGPHADRPAEAALCAEVRRSILEGVDWPCAVQTDFADHNLGCGPRIFSGLQWAFTQVEEAIILEDDCLPHPAFFRFAQELLARYRKEPRVFMIAGTNFRGACPDAADRYLFSRHCTIWGWATWRRALAGYTLDMTWWRTAVQPRDFRVECADWRELRFITECLDSQKSGAVNSWDFQWFAHVFRRGGFSVVPGTNLISNLGAVGAHFTGRTANHLLPVGAARFPLRAPSTMERDRDYERHLVERHRFWGGWIVGVWAARALRSSLGPLLRRCWHALKCARGASATP